MNTFTLGALAILAYGLYQQTVANIAEAIQVSAKSFRLLPLKEQSLTQLKCGLTISVRNPTSVAFDLIVKAVTVYLKRGSEVLKIGESSLQEAATKVASGADTSLPEIRFGFEWARMPTIAAELLKSGEKTVIVKTSYLVNGSVMEDTKTFPVRL